MILIQNVKNRNKQVKLNESEIIERKLTSQELEDREKIAKKLPMDDFKKRYGKDAMAVKMATATNIVKKKSQNETIEDELGERTGKYSKMNLDKAKKLMGPSKNREQGVKMVMKGLGTTYKHANQLVDKILGVNPKTGKIESAELDEYTLTKLDKMMGIKKGDHVFFVSGSNAEGNVYAQNEKEAMEKAKKKGIRGRISVRDKGEYKGQPRLVNSVNEGYESEVMKVLNKADIDGYFKMGKLYVNKRDGKDAKKALEDSDEITKLPKMVMEDNKMMKLTKRQRQALSSPAAKGKGSITLPGAEFLSKKKQPMKVGRQSQVVKYEAYDIGNDYAKHTLDVTPGQSRDDVDEMLGIAEKKRTSMREALAKMWGMDEGKNPFEKSEKKDLTKEGEHDKTLTGKKPTKVDVDPKMEKK